MEREWRVQKLNDSDFAVFFPSKESLRMAIREEASLYLPASSTSSSPPPLAT
jgi:hypothetical protein